MSPLRLGTVDVYDTTAELDPSDPTGQFAIVLNPLTLYVYTSTGYQVVGSGTNPPAPTPASEAGQGVVELASAAEVESGAAGVLVASAARLKAEFDRRGAIAGTETVPGPLELATATETQDGTDTVRAVHPAGLKAAITPPAWTAPTLLNSWVNFGAPYEGAGYRKTPWGEVQLKGMIKNGTTANGTVLFTLPVGYRPANTRAFPSLQGLNASCRVDVSAAGDVTIQSVTNANLLALDGVRFDAA